MNIVRTISHQDIEIYIEENTKFYLETNSQNCNKDIAKLMGLSTRAFTSYVKKNFNATMCINTWNNSVRNLEFKNLKDVNEALNWIQLQIK